MIVSFATISRRTRLRCIGPVVAMLLGEVEKVNFQLQKSCDIDVSILIDSAKHQAEILPNPCAFSSIGV